MTRNLCGLVMVCAAALFVPGCGHDQQLVGITIQPGTETFGASNIPVSADAGSSVQLKAYGSYIHPPVTKDITNQVTWFSNTPQMVTVNSTGLITATGRSCGGTIISATVTKNSSDGGISSTGAIISGNMTANVVCFTGGGGGPNPTLSVDLAGPGTGSVTIVPPGLICQLTCAVTFASASPVNITATPNTGSSFMSWSGCDSTSGQLCTINDLTSSRTVTVTFN